MSPLCLSGKDASVGDGVGGIRLQLEELVRGPEDSLIVRAAVTNDYLR